MTGEDTAVSINNRLLTPLPVGQVPAQRRSPKAGGEPTGRSKSTLNSPSDVESIKRMREQLRQLTASNEGQPSKKSPAGSTGMPAMSRPATSAGLSPQERQRFRTPEMARPGSGSPTKGLGARTAPGLEREGERIPGWRKLWDKEEKAWYWIDTNNDELARTATQVNGIIRIKHARESIEHGMERQRLSKLETRSECAHVQLGRRTGVAMGVAGDEWFPEYSQTKVEDADDTKLAYRRAIVMMLQKWAEKWDTLSHAFREMDVNHDGDLSRAELATALIRFNIMHTDDLVEECCKYRGPICVFPGMEDARHRWLREGDVRGVQKVCRQVRLQTGRLEHTRTLQTELDYISGHIGASRHHSPPPSPVLLVLPTHPAFASYSSSFVLSQVSTEHAYFASKDQLRGNASEVSLWNRSSVLYKNRHDASGRCTAHCRHLCSRGAFNAVELRRMQTRTDTHLGCGGSRCCARKVNSTPLLCTRSNSSRTRTTLPLPILLSPPPLPVSLRPSSFPSPSFPRSPCVQLHAVCAREEGEMESVTCCARWHRAGRRLFTRRVIDMLGRLLASFEGGLDSLLWCCAFANSDQVLMDRDAGLRGEC
eukprot:2083662-Rhodomonas_salina.2